MPFQTLFYSLETGEVLNIQPNLLIRKQSQKAPYSQGRDINGVGVYYLDGVEPLKASDVEIRKVHGWGVRLVADKKGGYRNIDRQIYKQRALLASAPGVVFVCEGGLGDHLLQAGALLEYKGLYPEKWAGLQVKTQYLPIMEKVLGLDWIGLSPGKSSFPKGAATVGGACEMMADPRGTGYGKASIYGTMLGLEKVGTLALIEPSEEDYSEALVLLERWQREWNWPLVGIQFVSGSGRGKSWPLVHVESLVRKIYEMPLGEAIIFGRGWEYPEKEPLGINFTGGQTWWETYLGLICCDAVVCIDSGVLHLCRSILKPHVGIWGGSTPGWILGEPDRREDLRIPLDCADWLCMECVKKTVSCMHGVKPEAVFHKVVELLEGIRRRDPAAAACES